MSGLVLGVSGSVAAYRACDLAREFMRRGFTVRTCLTDSGQKFVTASLFEALTGQPCLQDTFEEPERGRMAHIDWARLASVMVVAPATANVIAKLAHGYADDMLTTIAVAFPGPIVVAPAMNPTMYASETNRAAMRMLAERGVIVVEPDEGEVACGEQGQGKLASIGQIVEAVMGVANRSAILKGKKILITSGPTQEPIDIARFVTNRSSGKMGAALTRAALLLGANVTVVSGPSTVPMPLEANIVRVRTADEMLHAGLAEAQDADIVIGAAAVADYRPASASSSKIRRGDAPISLEMVPNPDVIAELAKAAKVGAKVVGFAAEPSVDPFTAKEKLDRKGLFAIAVNDVSGNDTGFEKDSNELTLVFKDGRTESSGKLSKLQCAVWLLDQIAH